VKFGETAIGLLTHGTADLVALLQLIVLVARVGCHFLQSEPVHWIEEVWSASDIWPAPRLASAKPTCQRRALPRPRRHKKRCIASSSTTSANGLPRRATNHR
jgi:hypothetical protein